MFSSSSYANTGGWITLFTNPSSEDVSTILGVRLQSTFDIGSFTFNRTNLTNYGDTIITADTTVTTFRAYSIAFKLAEDRLPPIFTAPKNATDIYQNTNVNFNTTWNDSVALAGYIFSINQTGVWVNSSYIEFNGKSNLSENISYIIADTKTNIGWMFYANDTSGNINQTDIFTFVVAGMVWNQTNITLPNLFTGNVRDSSALITSYGTNNNIQIACIGDCSVIKENFSDGTNLNDLESAVIGFNCSSVQEGNFSANFTLSSDGDITLTNLSISCNITERFPFWYNNLINDSAIYQGDTVRFNTTWNDTVSLNYSLFSTNISSLWLNDTRQQLNGKIDVSTNVSYINQTPGTRVGWRFYVNDSLGNTNQTDIFEYTVLGILWNQSTLSFGIVDINGVSNLNAKITSYGNNNNLQVSCAGNCSTIQDDFSDGTNLIDLDSIIVRFNCTSLNSGNYSNIK